MKKLWRVLSISAMMGYVSSLQNNIFDAHQTRSMNDLVEATKQTRRVQRPRPSLDAEMEEASPDDIDPADSDAH